ncbi:MAG: RluA family pseudouridine synthase [Candidatus Krumholzibacteria bacterium]
MTEKKQEITLSCRVDSYRSGWTVLEYLTHRFRYHPEGRWRLRILEGRVRINGSLPASDSRVRENDRVSYTIYHNEPEVDFHYDVVYEDDHLLAVSKSGNLPVHASGIFIRNTLIATLKSRYGDHINLAHRLDRETSGLVLLTKSRVAARRLGRMFSERRVRKSYLAVVHGRAARAEFEVDAPIGKAPHPVAIEPRRESMRDVESELKEDLPRYVPRRCVDFEKGKAAKTLFRVERHQDGFTVLHAEPLSGRTNQIRVHLEHAGYPIVGDKVYGDRERDRRFPGLTRQALHCRSLEFVHPMEGEGEGGVPLKLEAGVPRDLEGLIG